MEKTCLECNEKLIGRADKKFCNDYCRNAFNNNLNKNYNVKISVNDSAHSTVDKFLYWFPQACKIFRVVTCFTIVKVAYDFYLCTFSLPDKWPQIVILYTISYC